MHVTSRGLLLLAWIAAQASGQTPHKAADWFFADPQLLCDSLKSQGIETQPWASYSRPVQREIGPFFCEGRPAPRELAKAPEEAAIGTIFRISGDYKSLADIISISVTVPPKGDIHFGQRDLATYVQAIFKAIDKPEPIALIRSIDTRSSYLARQPYGILWFDVVRPQRDPSVRVLWFRLSKHEVESSAAAN